MESGILKLNTEKVQVVPFLKECFYSFRAEAIERQVELQCLIPLLPMGSPAEAARPPSTSIITSVMRRVSTLAPVPGPSEGRTSVRTFSVAGRSFSIGGVRAGNDDEAIDGHSMLLRNQAAAIAPGALPLHEGDCVDLDKFKVRSSTPEPLSLLIRLPSSVCLNLFFAMFVCSLFPIRCRK